MSKDHSQVVKIRLTHIVTSFDIPKLHVLVQGNVGDVGSNFQFWLMVVAWSRPYMAYVKCIVRHVIAQKSLMDLLY